MTTENRSCDSARLEEAQHIVAPRDSALQWGVLGACFLLSIVLGLLSKGCYHDDDLTHYLMARWAWWYPEYLLHIWGRPGLTVPLAGVAWIGDRYVGWHAARVLSALATAGGALISARLARRLGVRRTWLVVLAYYAQPLSALLSFTTLTENWTALYLIGAVYLLHARCTLSASLVFSLVLVSRHEALVFLPIWWLALFLGLRSEIQLWHRFPTGGTAVSERTINRTGLRRTFTAGAISLWAPVAHNLLFYAVFQEWPAKMYFQPGGSTEYVPAGVLSYLPQALYAMTPLVIALAISGAAGWMKRDRWLVVAFPAVFFLTHCTIKALGLFASGGYGRFMVAVTPFIAILAGGCLESWFNGRVSRSFWPAIAAVVILGWVTLEIEADAGRLVAGKPGYILYGRILSVGLASLCATCWALPGYIGFRRLRMATGAFLILLLIAQFIGMVRPLRVGEEQQRCLEVASWLREKQLVSRPLFVTHPWLVYEIGLVEHPRAHKGPRLLASMPLGTVVVWDSRYTGSDFHGIGTEMLDQNPSFQPMRTFFNPGDPKALRLEAFTKVGIMAIPPDLKEPYPLDLPASRRPVTGVFYLRE